MASNYSNSSMITPYGLISSFESVSQLLLCITFSALTFLLIVGLMLYKLIIIYKNHNKYGISKEFGKPHKI